MKRCLTFILMMLSFISFAATELPLKTINIDIKNKERLQRGAQVFMNYCSGCHSLKYLRYNQMANDLGLTTFDGQIDKPLLKNNLIFTSATIHDPIQISMPAEDARQWFGRKPPDLSLSARERGPNWLYTYLNSFYVDASRPFGSNNRLVPDVGMPNILAPLQGTVIAKKIKDKHQQTTTLSLMLIEKGTMTQQQFDSTLQDLVNFLTYVSEPNRQIRYQLGWPVLIFLGLLAIVAYRLKKAYWQTIHE